MPAVVYNLEIEQGTTFTQTFVKKDGGGLPVNLTDYTARMQIRPSISSGTVMLELTTENGGILLGGVTGEITLVFTEANTKALTRNGVYDLELDSGSTVERLLQGEVIISKEVTRDE